MRIYSRIQAADAKEMRRQGELAFTMVEIAIAIGVIGFALVAIIGILPAGLDVQKDNREDTLISQDAPYFMDAIRNGAPVVNGGVGNSARGLDFLTNYVQAIRVDYLLNGGTNYTSNYSRFASGAEIIGLLTTPQVNYNSPFFASNYFDTTATVRALSGPATEQQTAGNTGLSSAMSFTYQMEVMITPFNGYAPDSTNWFYYSQIPNVDPNQVLIRSNRWLEATPGVAVPGSLYLPQGSGGLSFNLFDVRLRFSWPVLQNGRVGPGRQTYRTLIAGQMAFAPTNGVPGWFFQPQTYTNVYPNGL
jgi:type II secretory pathway pseudopilin PulG